MVSRYRNKVAKRLVRSFVAILLVSFSFFPFLYMILASFTEQKYIFSSPPTMIPPRLVIDNYVTVVSKTQLVPYLKNSALIAGSVVLLTLLFAAPAAYGLTRFEFRGRRVASVAVILCYLLPSVCIAVPLFVMFRTFHLLDTHLGIIVAHLAITLPMSVWLMRGYFTNFPWVVEEAAMVDGCTRLTAIYRIVLPLSAPGLAAVLFFAFAASWDEFLYVLLFTGSDTRVASLELLGLIGEEQIGWGAISAGAIIYSLPVMVLFLLTQRYFVRALVGAVKG